MSSPCYGWLTTLLTGNIAGSIFGGRWSDRTLARLKAANGGVSTPEVRIFSLFQPIVLFMKSDVDEVGEHETPHAPPPTQRPRIRLAMPKTRLCSSAGSDALSFWLCVHVSASHAGGHNVNICVDPGTMIDGYTAAHSPT